MKKLHLFSDFHEATEELATETIGLLGRKGSGKTYGAGVLVEELVRVGVPVVAISPLKVYYGLRLSADGKSPGLDLIILGGLYGDAPLNENAGALIADLVIDSGRNFVIDTSQFSFTKRKRFCTEFGERFWLRKKDEKNPTPIHVVLEEAQTILPQNTQGEAKGEYSAARMLGVWEEIVRLGRNAGIGVTLISQRPQSVNKEALTQVEVLVCFQLNGTPERKAVKEWVTYHGLDVDLVEQLPQLGIGKDAEGYLWSPSVLKTLRKVHFRPKHTFDSSATPKSGHRVHQVDIKPIDLTAIREKIASLEQEAKVNDPSALKRRVLQLEHELAAAKRAPPATSAAAVRVKTEVKRVEVPILKDSQTNALERSAEKMAAAAAELAGAAKAVTAAIAEAKKLASPAPAYGQPATRLVPPMVVRAPAQTSAPVEPGDAPFGAGERKMLAVIAQYDGGIRAEATQAFTGFKRSYRNLCLQHLRKLGYVEGPQVLVATPAGIAALGTDYEPLPVGAALLEHWRHRLPEGERKVLEVIVAGYPEFVAGEVIDEQTGYKRSYRNLCLQSLQRRQLVSRAGGTYQASALLFNSGARGAA